MSALGAFPRTFSLLEVRCRAASAAEAVRAVPLQNLEGARRDGEKPIRDPAEKRPNPFKAPGLGRRHVGGYLHRPAGASVGKTQVVRARRLDAEAGEVFEERQLGIPCAGGDHNLPSLENQPVGLAGVRRSFQVSWSKLIKSGTYHRLKS